LSFGEGLRWLIVDLVVIAVVFYPLGLILLALGDLIME